jgi:anionic cell wall polymer biosynthesis LytR-Cps2A-Psr (LCP) family protein
MGTGEANAAKGRPLRVRTVLAVVLLLLVLVAVVAALVTFRNFRGEVHTSNRRVPRSAQKALAPSGDFLSRPQVILVNFEKASLFVRTDPKQHRISILSVPANVAVQTEGGGFETFEKVYSVSGNAGVIRLARSALGLLTTHVALIEPNQIGSLVAAVGGVHIRDRAYALSLGRTGDAEIDLQGEAARRYLDSAGSPGADLRNERERILLNGVVNRLLDVANFSTLRRLAHTFSKTVATDLSPAKTLALALLRLRTKSIVECSMANGSSFPSSGNKRVLLQFHGGLPTRANGRAALPQSGCGATNVSATSVPEAIISLSGSAIGLLPFLPAIAIVAIALDLMMLLILLRVPQVALRAASGVGRFRMQHGRPLTETHEPRPGREEASLSGALTDRLREKAGVAHHPIPFASRERKPTPSSEMASVQVVETPPQESIDAGEGSTVDKSWSRGRGGENAPLEPPGVSKKIHTPWSTGRFAQSTLAHLARKHFRPLSRSLRWGLIAASVAFVIGYLVTRL